eukprot:126898_1
MPWLDDIKATVHPQCIGLAIFIHEFTGIAWMIGVWSAMYILNPTASLIKKYDALHKYQNKAEQWTHRKIQRMPSFIRQHHLLNWPRLVSSGIESYLFRNVLRPVTIPAKFAFAVYAAKLYSDRKYGSKARHTNNKQHHEVSA